MKMPIINTSTTNLELTKERQSLITQKLAPLGRFLVHEEEVLIDVSIRRMESHLGSDAYYLSVKLTTERGVYMAVATSRYLTRALAEAREYLRRSICRGESVELSQFKPPSRAERELLAS